MEGVVHEGVSMNLKLLNIYHIRVYVSACIIIFAPLTITIFLCFKDIATFASSSVIIAVLLAFTNYLPILQRHIHQKKIIFKNYAAEFLMPDDENINKLAKVRYYEKLREASFSAFEDPDKVIKDFDNSKESDKRKDFFKHCESAVSYLREKTRNNPLILEDNINFGLCRALYVNKTTGILMCIVCGVLAATYSILSLDSFSKIPIGNYIALSSNIEQLNFESLAQIPAGNYIAFLSDIALLIFWIFGVNKEFLENTAKHYAKTLIAAIDSL